jgi:endonuclease IV
MKKFGIKINVQNKKLLYNSIDLINEGIFDYIELLINPQSKLTKGLIDDLADIKLIIHAPHENYGVDIGKAKKKDITLKAIKKSLNWQKKLGAEYTIIHCGTGNIELAKKNLIKFKEFKDLIILENMPFLGLNGEKCLGYNFSSFNELNIVDFGLCLDFGHAVKASLSLKEDYRKIISEFLELKPKVFHVSDGKLDKETDEHLNIGEGEYDLIFFMKCVKSSDLVTLETPTLNPYSLEESVTDIEKLRSLWHS